MRDKQTTDTALLIGGRQSEGAMQRAVRRPTEQLPPRTAPEPFTSRQCLAFRPLRAAVASTDVQGSNKERDTTVRQRHLLQMVLKATPRQPPTDGNGQKPALSAWLVQTLTPRCAKQCPSTHRARSMLSTLQHHTDAPQTQKALQSLCQGRSPTSSKAAGGEQVWPL